MEGCRHDWRLAAKLNGCKGYNNDRNQQSNNLLQQLDNLRKSLKDGTAFDHRTGAPKALTEEDRQQLLDQMPPHHRIQALRRNFDRDTASQTFR